MKILLIITTLFTLTGVISATITDTSCSQKKSETKEIEYQINGKLTKKGDKLSITILNYQELENVVVKSDDPTILSVEGPDENGIITVIALVDEDSGTISITAKDSKKVQIPLSITDKVKISATLGKDALWQGESTTLTIQNIEELKEPTIDNNTPDFIKLTEVDLDKGTAIVTALNMPLAFGIITINAKNAIAEWDLFVTIKMNKTIDFDIDRNLVDVGETAVLTISNINEFVGLNLQVSSEPTGFVEVGEIDEQGKVLITGIKAGSTTLKITADHTEPGLIPFEII